MTKNSLAWRIFEVSRSISKRLARFLPSAKTKTSKGPVCFNVNFTRFIAFAGMSVMVLHGFERRSPSKSAENKNPMSGAGPALSVVGRAAGLELILQTIRGACLHNADGHEFSPGCRCLLPGIRSLPQDRSLVFITCRIALRALTPL